jgi:hypothetical protein
MTLIDQALHVTIGTGAKLADISRLHMRNLVQRGQLPGFEIDNQWFVLRSAAASFVRDPKRGRP